MIQRAITGDSISGRAVIRRERDYQYHVLERGRVNTVWIVAALALMIPAVLMAVAVATAAVVTAIAPDVLVRTLQLGLGEVWLRNLVAHMAGMALATDLVVSLIAVALAGNAVNREYEGATWPLLLMTGITARHLVLGKWWASVLVLRRDFISVAILRVGVITALYLYPPSVVQTEGLALRLGGYLLAVALTLAFSVLDAQLTAALAVLGALFAERATGAAFLLRLGALIVGALAVALTVLRLWDGGLQWVFLAVPTALVTLWALLLAVALWAALMVGVRARILPTA